MQPHRVEVSTIFREININFTPLGYYHFFKQPLAELVEQTEILEYCFGKNSISIFNHIFAIANRQQQVECLEHFLLQNSFQPQLPDLQSLIHFIHQTKVPIHTVHDLQLQCYLHTKKIYRLFKTYLAIRPKEYLQINHFRQGLNYLQRPILPSNLTQIAHQLGYYDQSHFIREFKFFTHNSPRKFTNNHFLINNLLLLREEIS